MATRPLFTIFYFIGLKAYWCLLMIRVLLSADWWFLFIALFSLSQIKVYHIRPLRQLLINIQITWKTTSVTMLALDSRLHHRTVLLHWFQGEADIRFSFSISRKAQTIFALSSDVSTWQTERGILIPVFNWALSARGMHCGRASGKEKAGCLCFRRGSSATTANMGTSLRELQHALQEKNIEMKMKDSRILALEQELKRRNEIIRRLESELDKYRSVLQPAVATRTRNRGQGISAEPQGYKNLADASKPLQRHSKSTK